MYIPSSFRAFSAMNVKNLNSLRVPCSSRKYKVLRCDRTHSIGPASFQNLTPSLLVGSRVSSDCNLSQQKKISAAHCGGYTAAIWSDVVIWMPHEGLKAGRGECYLDNQRLDSRKASEEAGKHLDFAADPKLQLQGQHLDARDSSACAHLCSSLRCTETEQINHPQPWLECSFHKFG
jgi:hypothetical protein